jgi:hypothetical protein
MKKLRKLWCAVRCYVAIHDWVMAHPEIVVSGSNVLCACKHCMRRDFKPLYIFKNKPATIRRQLTKR